MTLRDFLNYLKIPIFITGIIITIFSFSSFFLGSQLVILRDRGLFFWLLHDLFYNLDYTHEVTFASWFQSLLFLATAAGFFLLGWGDNIKMQLTIIPRRFFELATFVLIFLSADEMISIHEQLGKKIEYTTQLMDNTKIQHLGYSWLFLYVPIIIIGLIILIGISNKLIKNIADIEVKKRLKKYFMLFAITLPLIFVCEAIEGYLLLSGFSGSIIVYFEELFEYIMLFSAFNVTLVWSNYYKL